MEFKISEPGNRTPGCPEPFTIMGGIMKADDVNHYTSSDMTISIRALILYNIHNLS